MTDQPVDEAGQAVGADPPTGAVAGIAVDAGPVRLPPA